MAVVRNNEVGELSVSSAQVGRQRKLDTSVQRVETTDMYVQGMKNFAVQVQTATGVVNQISILIQGAIATEGNSPDFFNIKELLLTTGGATNYIYDQFVLPVQFVRIETSIPSGSSDLTYTVRIMASQ